MVYKNIIGILFLFVLFSCVDESLIDRKANGSFIEIQGMGSQSATHAGSPEDYTIETLRILTFDINTQDCISNIRYNTSEGDIIRHPVIAGKYDFVFLANEPDDNIIESRLDGISKYADLNSIAYPERFFTSDRIIPMIQEINNVTILPENQGAKLSDGTSVSLLQLKLDRLGVRFDAVLVAVEAEADFDNYFEGITFSGVPDLVPLTAHYNGPSVNHSVTRKFSRDTKYIADTTTSVTGATWAKRVSRVILPANELETKDDEMQAVTFTINMKEKYSPTAKLKISSSPVNYSLPINTKLDLTGIIRESLDVNIEASEWGSTDNEWDIAGNRILNVSETDVRITDFNGARISFWSNMPVVRVENTVRNVGSGEELDANTIFNALSTQSWSPNKDERFLYNPATGAGYMDILLDRPNTIGETTYEVRLTAADSYSLNADSVLEMKNPLTRTILVHVKQEGKRADFVVNSEKSQWSHPYIGAFFADNETGERVISGNRYSYWNTWKATVPEEYRDFIIISSTPSFDPTIGTDSPGDAEDYPVIPNAYKEENGYEVTGKSRIYFRIGLKKENTTGVPRYGAVEVTYVDSGNDVKTRLYVRQGGEADYLMRSGSSGSGYGAKFSPYNLTAKVFRDNPETKQPWININKNDLANSIAFVKYPTQAGAHFQWGLPVSNPELALRAYYPVNRSSVPPWIIDGWSISYISSPPLWSPKEGTKFEDYYEICPESYRRPTDGPVDRIAVNSNTYADQVNQSDWRMSLFQEPMQGDGSSYTSTMPYDVNMRTVLYSSKILENVKYGYYADGFFDRRPIKTGTMLNGSSRETGLTTIAYNGVSLYNANAAFGGTLLFNPETNASVFFPAAGRRWHQDGSLEYAGETGYYWSSSVAPGWTNIVMVENVPRETGTPFGNIWSMELNYASPAPKSMSAHFGYSIRCVRK